MFLSTMFYIAFWLEGLYGEEGEQLAIFLSTIPVLFSLNYFFIFKNRADRLKISISIVIPLPLSLIIIFISGLYIGYGIDVVAILISAFIMFYYLVAKNDLPKQTKQKQKSIDQFSNNDYDAVVHEEIDKAFEFYLNQYKQKYKNMEILVSNGDLEPSVEYRKLPFDIKSLESKNVKFLFELMLKEDKMKQYLIDEQIRQAEERIEDTIRCMKEPDEYKTEIESIEEFYARAISGIEFDKKVISRLKAGDYSLCKHLISRERDA